MALEEKNFESKDGTELKLSQEQQLFLKIIEIQNSSKEKSFNELPIEAIATLDYIKNPDRKGMGGLDRGSSMFKAALLCTSEADHIELYRKYDKAWMAANLKDDFQPKIAILQLRKCEENYERRFISVETLQDVLHEQPDIENYELIYVRNSEQKIEQEQQKLVNALYNEFNTDTLRPSNYYGHSLSVSDIIIIVNDFYEHSSYYIDDIGFTKLQNNFLSHEMNAKIRNNLDIRQESVLFENINRFEVENAVPIGDESDVNRQFQIASNYLRIFEMADQRQIIMDMSALGYEVAYRKGVSEDFLMFQAANNESNTFGFDGWDAVQDFTVDVHTLLKNYTVQELQDRMNRDYNKIEYGTFGDRAVETALRYNELKERSNKDNQQMQKSNTKSNKKKYIR